MEALIKHSKIKEVNSAKRIKMIALLLIFLVLLLVIPAVFAQSATLSTLSAPIDGNVLFIVLVLYLFFRSKLIKLGKTP